MPELPEVQTVVSELNQQVQGRTINSVNILRDTIIQNPKSDFVKAVKGQLIVRVDRKGKYILFELQQGGWILAHLRMTGKFIVQKSPVSVQKHDRVIFELDNQLTMIFNDVRCFGTLEMIFSLENNKKINQLGWEPWDRKLTPSALRKKFKNRSMAIKTLLLDQGIIAGLGNIYAAEILFHAKISPFKTGKELTNDQLSRLIESTRFILEEALHYNGTSISDYRRIDDKQGTFQNFLQVYGKEGNPCSICSSPVLKKRQNQRSTFYCSQCQI